MNILKRFCLLWALAIVLAPGCGKKKSSSKGQESKELALSSNENSQFEIPLYEDEDENLVVDNDDISDFAFVDDEILDLDAIDSDDEQVAFAELDEDEDLVASREEEEESLFDELEVEVDNDDIFDDADQELSFKTVHFDLNKSGIREDQKEALQEDIETARLAVEDGKKVIVEGHCDQTGPAAYNLVLSQRRAEAIKKELVKAGLDEDDIKTVGYGYEKPLVWTDAVERDEKVAQLAPNRRAELHIN